MPSYKDFYAQQSDFVSLKNWKKMPDPLTITRVVVEELWNPTSKAKENSILAYLKEVPQKLVLPPTRCSNLEGLGHGDDYTKWVGLQISLAEGKTSAGRRMLIITKAIRPQGKQAQPKQPTKAQGSSGNGNKDAANLYLDALDEALKAGVPTRYVDVGPTGIKLLEVFTEELHESMAAMATGEVPGGQVKPYVALAFVTGSVDALVDIDPASAAEVAPDAERNQLMAAIVKKGVPIQQAQKAVAWLSAGDNLIMAEVNAILALIETDGVDVQKTFAGIAKTVDGGVRDN